MAIFVVIYNNAYYCYSSHQTVIAILGHIVAATASATVTPTLYNALLGGSFAAFRRFQKSLGFETFG